MLRAPSENEAMMVSAFTASILLAVTFWLRHRPRPMSRLVKTLLIVVGILVGLRLETR